MKSEYSDSYLIDLLSKQLAFFLVKKGEIEVIKSVFNDVIKRLNICFAANKNKYYSKNGLPYFNPFHSGQYCIFLYYLSNTIYINDVSNKTLCDKIYFLNRMLNCCDLFYEVNLPDVFMVDHPLGSVIGRGEIGNYFEFSQGCTIGNNKGIYPKLGENVTMLSNSKIIGKSKIGNNVIIAANTFIKDQNVPNNSIVFGSSPNLIFKKNK